MTTTTQPAGPVIARAGSYYRRTRYIMFIVLFGFGVYAIYDGFKGYPEHNRKFDEIDARIAEAKKESNSNDVAKYEEELRKHGAKQSDFNVLFNRIVGLALPPLSLLMLAWVLYRSRGEIRMENDTLHFPGHPPVPFSAITAVDTRLWDRKGIAQVEYALPEGQRGKFTLDDFIYERPPIDTMYDSITGYIKDAAAPESLAEGETKPQG